MTSILQLQVLFPESAKPKHADKDQEEEQMFNETTIKHNSPLDINLSYRNTPDYDDVWHLLAKNKLNKKFTCAKSQYSLDCDMIQLFELGSVHHEFYLINIKLGQSDVIHNVNQNDEMAKYYLNKDLPEVRLVLTVSSLFIFCYMGLSKVFFFRLFKFIYQTGGFTQMWFMMKSVIFPFVLIVMCWFWNRIVKLDRKSNLLEQVLFSLGLATTLLNRKQN